jgi:hypothetical protein
LPPQTLLLCLTTCLILTFLGNFSKSIQTSFLKDLLPVPLGLQWTSPHLVIHTTPTAVRLNGIPQWQHLLRNGHLKSSREQHFTVVLLANAHPNAYISCCLILKLPPLYHTICLLLLIKNLTSCTSRDNNFSKTAWKNYCEDPIQDATGA